MPMHDWTSVEAGIYHDFHLEWISKIKAAINHKLPKGYYALAEQRTGIFSPDILALKLHLPNGENHPYQPREDVNTATMVMAKPTTRRTGTATEFYLQKQRAITIRHISGDKLVAVVELVSPGNKSSTSAVDDFTRKVIAYLKHGIHVSFIDPFAPSSFDPKGLHAVIWDEMSEFSEPLSDEEPLAVVSYHRSTDIDYFLEPFGVGMVIPKMPVFLVSGGHIEVPLEETYNSAFEAVPARWRDVIAAGK